ncbi:MAG: Hpt domain-containing protein [Bacteroidota bacterium]|nr:Hpt domain-containing protein [Bacteroidota bacterium]
MKKYKIDALKEQCGYDPAFFNEMLDTFIVSTEKGVEGMEEALLKHDNSALAYYAHKIVSPCRHIEADNLVLLLKELENKSASEKMLPEEMNELVKKIRSESEELKEELKKEYL